MRFSSFIAAIALPTIAVPGVSRAQHPAWTFETAGPIYASPALHDGTVYIGSGDGRIYAIDAANGSERWRFQTGGPVDARPAVADGLVYAPSRDGSLYAVDAADGSMRWSFRTGGERRHDFWDFYLSDPLIHEELVLFGSGDGHVFAVDRTNGAERWRHVTGGLVHGGPVADDRHVDVGGFDGVVYALQLDTGEPAWTYRVEGNEHFPRGELQRGPTLDDGVLFIGSRDYHLYALDAADGRLLWRIKEGDGWMIAAPLVDGECLFFGASDGQRFYAADRTTGAVRWSVPVHTRVFGSALRVQDVVVFGGFNGKLVALDPRDGATRWAFQTPASRALFPSVYDADGAINGEMREMYRTGRGFEAEERILSLGSIAGTPAAEGSLVFFGSTEGVVYAIDVESAGAPAGPLPGQSPAESTCPG